MSRVCRQDSAGVRDFVWTKVSDSDPNLRWSVPICHSAGGGDNVLVRSNRSYAVVFYEARLSAFVCRWWRTAKVRIELANPTRVHLKRRLSKGPESLEAGSLVLYL
jgi:hypothetical protein